MDVNVLTVEEPTMSSRHGRIRDVTEALMQLGINIEHIGDMGSYGVSIVLDGTDKDNATIADKAEAALRTLVNGGGQVTREEQAMLTAVGHDIIHSSTFVDSVLNPITDQFTSGIPHRFQGRHAKRVTVDREHKIAALKTAHRELIEAV